MSLTPDLRRELEDLLDDLLAGALADEDRSRLNALLLSNSEAQQVYLDYFNLHAALARSASAQPSESEREQSLVSTVGATEPPLVPSSIAEGPNSTHVPPSHLPTVPSPRSPVLGFLASVSRHVPGGEFTVGSLLLLVIVAAFWGLSQAILFPRLGGHDLAEDSSPSAEAVAMIRDSDQVEWSADHSALSPQHSEIAAGHPLSIQSGLIELELTGGTRLLIEGPADWQINGENSATLTHGKLVARVPQQAIGFTLETPSAKIIDLGTEFGVEVGEQGTAEVHVVKGLIDVRGAAGSARGPGKLKSGQTVRITQQGSTVETSSTVPDKFKRLVDAGNKSGAQSPTAKHSGRTRMIDFSQGAVVTQSSQYSAEFPAKHALDGNLGSTFHSGPDDDAPWWQVDLGSPRTVAAVIIYSAPGTRLGRFRDITIKILKEDGKTVVAASPLLNPKNIVGGDEGDWWKGPTQLAFEPIRTLREPVVGRFIRVERAPCDVEVSDDDHTVLTLAEVQVVEEVSDSKMLRTSPPPSK